VDLPIIASGGIRTGIDMIKSIALGASLTSATFPFLELAMKDSDCVKNSLEYLIEEFRNAMFLVGAKSIQELTSVPIILTGKIAEWLKMRGFNPEIYARRKECNV
ncbi:alpha-hydroxy-acid oxidizing protein, partial [Candidatus Bathyarchaeota archaeon]|nr:alpha-hydroxy-acid oxidizing protein [Candidatus Bathyarchaeota archaeon]